MTPAEFKQHAMTWGGLLARWPEPLRAQAEELLVATPELADVLAAQSPLDTALVSQAPEISGARLRALEQRIFSRTVARPSFGARLRDWLNVRELSPLAAGVLLALVIGWGVRESRPAPEAVAATTPDNAVMAMLEFDGNGLGVL